MDSSFKHILQTNTVPSDADCQRIQALLVGPRKQAEELTQEIGRIQAMLADLTQKRDHLVDFIDAHLALVSPARRLPDDVVREIFEASLPSEYAVMRGDEPPLLLRQICQPWRRLAQSTPRLWATLHVAASPSDKMEKMRDAVNVWIARSGSVPLSLSFLARRFDSDCDISSVLKTFVGVAYRWKDIRLVVSEGHLGPLAVLSPHDVPMLQRAVVKGAAARKFLSFMGAPTLRSVALMAQETTFHSLPLHWHTLVHLSIEGYIEVREALALLRQSPRLETCNLHVQSVEGPVSPIPCHLEHLSQLCLDDWSLVGASLFRALVLPSLRRLEYTCQFVVKGHSLPFLNLLYPDNCLECLSLNIGQLPEESVLEALCLVPMLQELCMVQNTVERVDRMRVANEPLSIVALLTSGSLESTDMLCPTLRSIRLLHTRVSDIELLAFIRSRTGPHLMNNHLSRVHVEFYDRPMQVDIMPSLLALIDNCLDVSLRYNYSPPPRDPILSVGPEPVARRRVGPILNDVERGAPLVISFLNSRTMGHYKIPTNCGCFPIITCLSVVLVSALNLCLRYAQLNSLR